MERVFNLGGVVVLQESSEPRLLSESEVGEIIFLQKAVIEFEHGGLIFRPIPLQVKPT